MWRQYAIIARTVQTYFLSFLFLVISINALPALRDEPDLYRLDRSLVPSQYYMRLQPDLKEAKFAGEVLILVKANDDASSITLHADDMNFTGISVLSEEEEELYQDKKIDEEHETFIIHLKRKLISGENYKIRFEYDGRLGDLYGFYISTYNDAEGQERRVAATHFQPTHARKAFPCFDEPSFKARFKLTLVISDSYEAVSNMPQESTSGPDPSTGLKEVTFKNSMVMSPYLVAFAVVDFGQLSREDNDIVFTSWARKNALEDVTFGLQMTPPILRKAEEYTGIKYTEHEDPLSKLEQIALPDFPAGAMEDWGLIVYRESRMLLNDGSADDRSAIATVIGHEVAHQWFGNLVTTAWWDALWLNEGFANYFEHYLLDQVDPTYRKMDQFVVGSLQGVMASDAALSSRPLTWPASSADEARRRFNTVSYSKGASFLRMICSIIGDENFKMALQNYLADNSYASVIPDDLFKAFELYVDDTGLQAEQWKELLVSWTTIPGFPVVRVQRDYVLNTALVSQERFLFKGSSEELYYVPLTWTEENRNFDNRKPRGYLTPQQPNLTLSIPDSDSWVIFNIQESGYYRVNYDERNWQLIIDYLKNYNHPLDNIHVLNRAQLLDDAFNLARAGQLPYATAFDLAAYLPREHDYVPWAAALSAFSYLDRMFASHEKYPLFQRFVRRLVARQYERFDFGQRNTGKEKHDEKLLLNRITSRACATDYGKCIVRASEAFLSFIIDKEQIEADLRNVAYCYGVRTATQHWEDLLNIYLESTNDAERSRLVSGLGCTRDADNLKSLLSLAIVGKHVRKQDTASVFSAVYSTPFGAEVVLEFLSSEENFRKAKDKLYININSNINSVISGVASQFTAIDQMEKLREFLTKYSEDLDFSFLQTTQDNIDWIVDNEYKIFSALEKIELEQYRLQNSAIPQKYQLDIVTAVPNRDFNGVVTISIEILKEVDTIVLHASSLEINEISVYLEGSVTDVYDCHSTDKEHEFVHIHLKGTAQKGVYIVNIKYHGKLRDDMYGFYLSTYQTKQGDTRYLAATQFQPTHARNAFPCFDEPQYKATFDISIHSPSGYRSLSNMPSVETEIGDDETFTRFYTSVHMSTYLLAFVVSDFDYTEKSEANDVILKTWSRPDAIPWAAYSIKVTPKLLSALEEYTNIKYTDAHENLNKLDQVAIPDFSAGAMENWGLITYRETALLYNDGPAAARKRVANTIAHELVHMWFGNLVTTKSWDSTWLNEGFAQYFQFYATSHAEPEWRILDQFVVDVQQTVYRSDMLASAEPLTARAYTPAQISARFGTITYSKGASFIRMLDSVLGPGNFQKALQKYLSENKLSVTEPADLFKHLQETSQSALLEPKEMEAFLISWTEQPGFPLITVTRDYEANTATVAQKRFLANENPNDTTRYYVPLTWAKQGENFENRRPQNYIPKEISSVTVNNMPDADSWVIFNVQETGYYRVNYDERNWALIAKHLAQGGDAIGAIHVLNRAQLIDDAFNLARGGHLSYTTAFDLADYLQHEADFIPWTAAATAFNFLDVMLAGHPMYNILQTYVLQLLDGEYKRLDFQDKETHVDKMHLNRITSLACSLGHNHCINSARNSLGEFLTNEVPVPADLRSTVYCYGVSSSSENWDALWGKYQESLDDAERSLIANALGCSTDSKTLKKYLQYSIDGESIRKQDAFSVFSAVYNTHFGADVALEFLGDNFHDIQEYYGSMNAMNNILMGISARLTTEDQKKKLEEFVANYAEELGASAVAALETVEGNIMWIEQNAADIIKILEEKVSKTPPADGEALMVGGTLLPLVIALAVVSVT